MRQHSDEYLRRFGKRRSRLIRFMIGLLLVCASFAGGFLVRGNVDFLTYLGFETAVNGQDANQNTSDSRDSSDSLPKRMAEVQGILEQSSLNVYDLDATTTQMLNILAEATDDPYVSYLDESHYETYLTAAANSYQGIGVLFGENNGQAYAVDVFNGSEAQAKGVKKDDYVVAIGGDRGTGGWTQAEVVRALSQAAASSAEDADGASADGEDGDAASQAADGAAGQSVVITWRRPASLNAEGGDEFTTDLKVSTYEEPNVKVELLDQEVGYIKLSQITSNSDKLVKAAIENLLEQGATCFVLDLRDNPGGYLTQAVDIGSLFVASGTFAIVEAKNATEKIDASAETATDAPLVVLVNAKTAAAAEVLAGGLQDNANGHISIVGENTMGKGTVQSVSQLSFGGGLRYTSAYYKTPRGNEINRNGIHPDIQVSASSSGSEDAQKAFAVDAAKSMLSSN